MVVILLVDEPVHLFLDILKIQPFPALAIDLCEQLVVVSMLTAAARMASYDMSSCKFPLV
jgi:hypothetical protein